MRSSTLQDSQSNFEDEMGKKRTCIEAIVSKSPYMLNCKEYNLNV